MKRLQALLGAPAFTTWISVVLMALLFAAGAVGYTGFASPQVVLNLLIDNAFLLVIAVGMSFVILSGGIDLSVGSVLALTTMCAAWLLQVAHWPAEAVIPLVLLGGAAFGALQGAVIQGFKLQPFIVTLAGMFLARGLCFLISVDSITIDAPLFVALSQTQIPLVGGAFLSPGAVIALAVLAVQPEPGVVMEATLLLLVLPQSAEVVAAHMPQTVLAEAAAEAAALPMAQELIMVVLALQVKVTTAEAVPVLVLEVEVGVEQAHLDKVARQVV